MCPLKSSKQLYLNFFHLWCWNQNASIQNLPGGLLSGFSVHHSRECIEQPRLLRGQQSMQQVRRTVLWRRGKWGSRWLGKDPNGDDWGSECFNDKQNGGTKNYWVMRQAGVKTEKTVQTDPTGAGRKPSRERLWASGGRLEDRRDHCWGLGSGWRTGAECDECT